MTLFKFMKAASAGGICAIALIGAAMARNFDIPGGDLDAALNAYITSIRRVIDLFRTMRSRVFVRKA